MLQLRRGLIPALLGGHKKGITYLLLDRFTTDASAPLTSPRTAQPGPGSWTVTDTNSRLRIVAGALTLDSAGLSFSDPGIVSIGSYARVAGRAYLVNVDISDADGIAMIGWVGPSSAGLAQHGIHFRSATLKVYASNTTPTTDIIVDAFSATTYQISIILQNTGAFYLIKGGAFTAWTLIWVGNQDTGQPLYAEIAARSLLGAWDNLRVTDLGGAWASDYGIATQRKATSADSDTITMQANALVEHTITAATGVTQELNVRYTDADNRWIVRMDQAGSTCKLIERNAGTETERSSAAQTWTNGSTYRVVVVCDGTTITSYVANIQKNTYASATLNQTATTATVSNAGADLVSWPRTVTLPAGV